MRFGILGYGVEGRSTLEYLWKQGERDIVIIDQQAVQELPYAVETRVEEQYESVLTCDVIFRTPGISPLHPTLVQARKQGVRITSQCNEFFTQVPCRVIGVTGTKGKGTTSTLIYNILRANGIDAYLGGNIGTPPLSLLGQLTETSWVVLELSSFQLMDLEHSPDIAVLLAIREDHLDYHGSVVEYRAAKAQLIAHQSEEDVCIYNADYEVLVSLVENIPARSIPCSTKLVQEVGVSIVDGMSVIATKEQHCSFLATQEFGLPGAFNYENIAPALAVAAQLHLLTEETKEVLRSFRGLPHRLELVREVRGVRFYDDSFATVPSTTIAALSAFPAVRKVVILGGSSKGADFSELVRVILEDTSVRGVVLLGTEEAVRIGELLRQQNTVSNKQRVFVTSYTGEEQELGVHYVSRQSQLAATLTMLIPQADVVLLSPGCASFDLFANYKERGDFFQQLVQELV